jgi:hypothetical protein
LRRTRRNVEGRIEFRGVGRCQGAPTSVSVGALPGDKGRGYVLTWHVGELPPRLLECGLDNVRNPVRDKDLRY